MRTLRISASILLVSALVATSAPAASQGLAAAVDGKVTSRQAPLRAASVYAYQLADLSLEKVVTDTEGEFSFAALPVGLYKIIAFKPGFVPTVVMLSRMAANTRQFLDLELSPTAPLAESDGGSFWELREKIPADVLRDIQIAAAEDDFASYATMTDEANFSARMAASTGVHQGIEYGEAQMAGGNVDIEGRFRNYLVGLSGDFSKLDSQQTFGEDGTVGRTQHLALELVNPDKSHVQVSSLSNTLTPFETGSDSIDFEHHMVSWSRPIGQQSHSEFSAQYTAESNFYSQGSIDSLGLPEASRALRVEGSYTTPVSRKATMQAGFRYRDLESDYAPSLVDGLALLPQETMELFSRGGVQLKPAVVVQYGLYSTLRDGSLSLVPQGGLVVNLTDKWRASGMVSHRIEREDEFILHDFTPAFFGDTDGCDQGAEFCYEVGLARVFGDGESASIGAVHRRYADTMRMYFDRDFYDRYESLFFVPGDELPEVKLALTHRLSPAVLTRFESNVASGGGGVLKGGDNTSYENNVNYMVTSLDTRLEKTQTGLYFAFHHLEQSLDPIAGQTLLPTVEQAESFSFGGYVSHPIAVSLAQPQTAALASNSGKDLELQRLQFMLRQDLSILHRLAADWAVHVNMEVSRGAVPDSAIYDEDELRRRLTGGIAVKF